MLPLQRLHPSPILFNYLLPPDVFRFLKSRHDFPKDTSSTPSPVTLARNKTDLTRLLSLASRQERHHPSPPRDVCLPENLQTAPGDTFHFLARSIFPLVFYIAGSLFLGPRQVIACARVFFAQLFFLPPSSASRSKKKRPLHRGSLSRFPPDGSLFRVSPLANLAWAFLGKKLFCSVWCRRPEGFLGGRIFLACTPPLWAFTPGTLFPPSGVYNF